MARMADAGLFAAGLLAWGLSTFAAGGASMLMLAAASALLAGHGVAPVVTCASLVGSGARLGFFWRHIDWRVVRWYVPGAVAGAAAGAWVFARLSSELVQGAIALFLMSTLWQYRLGERARSFRMPLGALLPVSFASGLTSAVVGAGAALGVWVTRPCLRRLPSRRFRQLAVLVMFASGAALAVSLARRLLQAGTL